MDVEHHRECDDLEVIYNGFGRRLWEVGKVRNELVRDESGWSSFAEREVKCSVDWLLRIVYGESLVSDIERACLMEVGYTSRCNHVCDKFGLWELVNLLWLRNKWCSCTGGYNPSLDHLMMTTHTLILGDFNAHHSSWYSSSTDTRGTMLESMVSGSNFGIVNWDTPTRLPGNVNPSSPDVSLASASLITSTNWQTKTNLGSDHLPILISLQMDVTITPIQHRTSINLKRQTGTDTVERLKTS